MPKPASVRINDVNYQQQQLKMEIVKQKKF